MIDETICVQESELSDIEILDIGKWTGSAIALGLLLITLVGLIARGLFVHFLNYEAPKDRPFNSLMFHEQVRYFLKAQILCSNSRMTTYRYISSKMKYFCTKHTNV